MQINPAICILFGFLLIFAIAFIGSICTKCGGSKASTKEERDSWEDFYTKVGGELNGSRKNGKIIWISKDKRFTADGSIYTITHFEIMPDGRWSLRAANYEETVVYSGILKNED